VDRGETLVWRHTLAEPRRHRLRVERARVAGHDEGHRHLAGERGWRGADVATRTIATLERDVLA
jgi:hypothetical protein